MIRRAFLRMAAGALACALLVDRLQPWALEQPEGITFLHVGDVAAPVGRITEISGDTITVEWTPGALTEDDFEFRAS